MSQILSTVRLAVKSDIPALYALQRAMGGGSSPPGYFEQCFEEHRAGRRDILIADGAGYAMLNWQPQYALYKKLGIPEIQDINVVPAARRQGTATALIKRCEDMALDRACAHIGISVALHAGLGPAQRLYAKLGYMPDGCGVTYDRQAVASGAIRPVDDNLCLMMIRDFPAR